MIQGTASFVGKTVFTLAIGRILSKKGYRVAPFKSQNMSLNSRVIQDHREIAWAQYFQALSIGEEPSFHMNPILLKPIGNKKTQVIVHGRQWKILNYKDYYKYHDYLWTKVVESIEELYKKYDLLIIEGAGSPAEINLYKYEIVNMRVASYLNSPVLLIGDIERGGVFASLWGTWSLVEHKDLIKGFVINKFRGDLSILTPGLKKLKEMTGVPTVGVVPYLNLRLPEEDSQGIPIFNKKHDKPIKIIKLPHISNTTDFFPLFLHNIAEYVTSPTIFKNTKIIIIPGSRNTIHDLLWLKKSGLFEWIKHFIQKEGIVIGICSGYQMLGEVVKDPYGIEGKYKEIKGFGFFKGETIIEKEKILTEVSLKVIKDIKFLGLRPNHILKGYEIHHGISNFETGTPIFLNKSMLGRVRENIFGTYLHGLFENKEVINGIGKFLGIDLSEGFNFDEEINKLEHTLRNNIDFDYIKSILC